jgi:pyruvate,water dikinase
MAVRSSASCEDSPQTSFAGMFKTVLGVKPPEIINAIREVLGSIFNKRVADYCEARSIDQNKIRMAVIVQRMINSRVSGVCFTRSQDERGPILIEACFGLGEALVSGKITPDLYIVDRGNFHITKETVGYQRFVLKLSEESMTPFYEELPFHKRNAKKLNNVQIVDVARTSLVIEESLSLEVADVEWAFEKDSLYILQARTFSGFKNDR